MPYLFFSALIDARRRDFLDEGILAVIPFWGPYFLIVLPYLIAFETEYAQFDEQRLQTVQSVFVNVALVTAGIYGAFCVTMLAHISNIASIYPFSDFLIEEKALDDYLFYPEYALMRIFIVVLWLSFVSILAAFFDAKWPLFVASSSVFSFLYINFVAIEFFSIMRKFNTFYIHYMNEYNKISSNI